MVKGKKTTIDDLFEDEENEVNFSARPPVQ